MLLKNKTAIITGSNKGIGKEILKVFWRLSKWENKMSKRYSGKSFKDSSVLKKPKLSLKQKRKAKKEKKK